MTDLLRDFWWLVFPLAGFAFAGAGMMFQSRLHAERMAILRTYAEKGQQPPAELLEPQWASGCGGAYGWRHDRAWRRQMRYLRRQSPYYQARRAVGLAVVAVVLFAAALMDGFPLRENGLMLAAIVVGAVAMGSLLGALPMFNPRDDHTSAPPAGSV